MYPDNNQQPNQQPYSIDYLNQIAPQAPKRPLGGPFVKIFIGLGIVAVVVVIAGLVLSMSAGQAPSMTRLAARLNSTETIVIAAQDKLTSSRLRTANSNLSIYLTNITRDIGPILESDGESIDKLPASVVSSESVTELEGKLEDARLNGVYDAAYSREMSFRLETIIYLISQLQDSSTGDRKEFLDTASENLQPIQTELANYATE